MAPPLATSACTLGCLSVRFIRAPATYSRARREEPALSLSIARSGGSALAFWMARWLSPLFDARFIRQPAPCSAGPPPDLTISTRGSMAPAAAIERLLSGWAARFISAPAASSCSDAEPLESSVTSGLMAPAVSIATWLSGFWHARFHSAKHACSFAGEAPFISSWTRCGRAPAATIAAWLAAFWMARLPRIPAAVSCTAAADDCSSATTAGMAPAVVICF
mmetsp:Transcript_14922/g.38503  ORF Transcript_14922/g.38503 Transcript_14922/m.38503 type:complete len:221 (-) Transcript_14922:41-703(-)